MGVPRYLCIMFLRKKPNKSGSTSVQVIVKTKNRKQRVVKTIGSSRDTDEIERLMAEGRKYISDQNGPLFPDIDEDENAVDAFVGSLTNSQIKVVGPELIFGRLYDYIGFNSIPSEMFRHMAICRLFNPGSKLKTVDYLERYLHVSYDISKIYRFLDNLCYRKDTKFEADAAWDGIKGYVTNTRLTPEEVIDSHGNLWFIERAPFLLPFAQKKKTFNLVFIIIFSYLCRRRNNYIHCRPHYTQWRDFQDA